MRKITPCDIDGICPYANLHSGYINSCEYWCGEEEPEDYPNYDDADDTPIYFDYYAERNWEEEP